MSVPCTQPSRKVFGWKYWAIAPHDELCGVSPLGSGIVAKIGSTSLIIRHIAGLWLAPVLALFAEVGAELAILGEHVVHQLDRGDLGFLAGLVGQNKGGAGQRWG